MANVYTEFFGDNVVLQGVCTVTGKIHSVRVSKKKFEDWHGGQMIQDAFPELSPDQREFIMTGTTPAEWDAMFEEE